MNVKLGVAVLAMVIIGGNAGAAIDNATAFGARQSFESMHLSPDGKRVAYLAPLQNAGTMLFVRGVEEESEAVPILKSDGRPENLDDCSWISNSRLLCVVTGVTLQKDGQPRRFLRQFAVDADGKSIRNLVADDPQFPGLRDGGVTVIDRDPDDQDGLLVARRYVTGQRAGRYESGFGVDRINTRDGKLSHLEAARADAAAYLSDGYGSIRIMVSRPVSSSTGYDNGLIRTYYRSGSGDSWKPLAEYRSTTREGFLPSYVDKAANRVVGTEVVDGFRSLTAYRLDGSAGHEVLVRHAGVDLMGVEYVGLHRKALGATYMEEQWRTDFLDADMKIAGPMIEKALPGRRLFFEDASEDGGILLIYASGETDPGSYYLYDRRTRKLRGFALARAWIDPATLAPVNAVRIPVSDGTQMLAYLTLPRGKSEIEGLRTIIIPPSRMNEHGSGYDAITQFFAAQGYAVLRPNPRGLFGSGNSWFGEGGFRGWRQMVGDLADAARWTIAQGAADRKVSFVGLHFGGYAALQVAATTPELVSGVAAYAPITDFELYRRESALNLNAPQLSAAIGNGKEIDGASPARNADKITAAVLLVHPRLQVDGRFEQSELMDRRLAAAGRVHELMPIEGISEVWLDSDLTAGMLRHMDEFLKSASQHATAQ